jgi:hypothetical protein
LGNRPCANAAFDLQLRFGWRKLELEKQCIVWIGRACEKNGGVSRTGVVNRSEPQLAKDGHASLTTRVRQGELHAVVALG